MREKEIDYYIVTTADAHNSEYVGAHDKVREYITGFTGSNGTLLVTDKDAFLWTDGRYYIQCENEIKGTGIKMMKQGEPGEPSLNECIASDYTAGKKIGFDGATFTKRSIDLLSREISDKTDIGVGVIEANLVSDVDLGGDIWTDRPVRSHEKVWIHDEKYAGCSVNDKLSVLRDKMNDNGCNQYVLSKLDDINWLFNIRGGDVECNPVALSYAFITMQEAFLFLQMSALDEIVRIGIKDQRIIICDYDDFTSFVSEYPYEGSTLCDDSEISYAIYRAVRKGYGDDYSDTSIVMATNPTTPLKAVKNETEIKWMRDYFLKDSVAMTKYIYYMKNHAFKNGEVTELSAAKYCDELRLNIPGCIGLSFPTIAAYGSNAAMMHYEACEDKYDICEQKGMLLTDCGGQYLGATTDVTRTISLGPCTDEEKKSYTLALIGWLRLMNAKWLDGCTGRNLDIIAREPLWQEGIDYKCGTGHGVGYCLNVHEGPQSIRWRYSKTATETVLRPGMIVTDEPGVYKEGKYGIRIENTLLVTEYIKTPDGRFLGFENLTYVPVDKSLIDTSLLQKSDLEMLLEYNRCVLEKLEGHLTKEELKWLKCECTIDC